MDEGYIFRSVYGSSRNFITGEFVKYLRISKHHVCEISKGRGIISNMLYGVTVVSQNRITEQWGRCDELNCVFNNWEDMNKYIEDLSIRFIED